MDSSRKPRAVTTPVIITVVLLILAAAGFFVALVTFSPSIAAQPTPNASDEASLAVMVEHLLSIGDPSRAEALSTTYSCIACHRLGGDAVAPQWTELMAVAGSRRPPLTAAEYIYESIVNPAVFIVDDYPPTMPQDFATRMSEQEIADILVYLVNGGT